MKKFSEIPPLHNEFINSSVEKLKNDKRIFGVAAGGSFVLAKALGEIKFTVREDL